jgi:hypothetical protein
MCFNIGYGAVRDYDATGEAAYYLLQWGIGDKTIQNDKK